MDLLLRKELGSSDSQTFISFSNNLKSDQTIPETSKIEYVYDLKKIKSHLNGCIIIVN